MQKTIQQRALRRLKIIEGQVRGLQKMVEKNTYCIDLLYQSMAIKEAISSVEDLILENHLATHVKDQMKSGQERKAVQEVIAIYKLAKKK
ncbi:metal-sensitive transcriptional regulator [Candidatus Parcubacteria bacterium]|nr:MAG: metal-sensitive transcriptional regulator [Candidatus Parcubacteria bacterium]